MEQAQAMEQAIRTEAAEPISRRRRDMLMLRGALVNRNFLMNRP